MASTSDKQHVHHSTYVSVVPCGYPDEPGNCPHPQHACSTSCMSSAAIAPLHYIRSLSAAHHCWDAELVPDVASTPSAGQRC